MRGSRITPVLTDIQMFSRARRPCGEFSVRAKAAGVSRFERDWRRMSQKLSLLPERLRTFVSFGARCPFPASYRREP